MRFTKTITKLTIGGVLAAALVIAGGTAAIAAEPSASAPAVRSAVTTNITTFALSCGQNISNAIPGGVYTLTYYNCASVSKRLKTDYVLVDGPCKTISPYGTASWTISQSFPNLYVGLISC